MNAMDEAVRIVMQTVDTETKGLSDSEYLQVLETVIENCQDKISAKNEE